MRSQGKVFGVNSVVQGIFFSFMEQVDVLVASKELCRSAFKALPTPTWQEDPSRR